MSTLREALQAMVGRYAKHHSGSCCRLVDGKTVVTPETCVCDPAAKQARAALAESGREGWVSTAERLPSDSSVVQVYQGDASMNQVTAYYLFGKWHWTCLSYEEPCRPEFWAPILSVPAKAAGEEQEGES